jgi:hypothetical protein
VDKVEITSSLDFMMTKTKERAVGLCIVVLLHQPTGRLGAEPNAQGKRHSGNECRAELKSPRNVTSVLDGTICSKAAVKRERGEM